ncbi:MAG: hypothetical protein MHM6MM_008604 [Cercozoa sp. M6MM]
MRDSLVGRMAMTSAQQLVDLAHKVLREHAAKVQHSGEQPTQPKQSEPSAVQVPSKRPRSLD